MKKLLCFIGMMFAFPQSFAMEIGLLGDLEPLDMKSDSKRSIILGDLEPLDWKDKDIDKKYKKVTWGDKPRSLSYMNKECKGDDGPLTSQNLPGSVISIQKILTLSDFGTLPLIRDGSGIIGREIFPKVGFSVGGGEYWVFFDRLTIERSKKSWEYWGFFKGSQNFYENVEDFLNKFSDKELTTLSNLYVIWRKGTSGKDLFDVHDWVRKLNQKPNVCINMFMRILNISDPDTKEDKEEPLVYPKPGQVCVMKNGSPYVLGDGYYVNSLIEKGDQSKFLGEQKGLTIKEATTDYSRNNEHKKLILHWGDRIGFF